MITMFVLMSVQLIKLLLAEIVYVDLYLIMILTIIHVLLNVLDTFSLIWSITDVLIGVHGDYTLMKFTELVFPFAQLN